MVCRCGCKIENVSGFQVCLGCGLVYGRHLSPTETHNNHVLRKNRTILRLPYCRSNRFNRLVKRLTGNGPRIPDDIVLFCAKQRPRSYEDVQYLVRIYRRETGKKPIGYAQIPSLHRMLTGTKLPTLQPHEIAFLTKTFTEIDFANRRQRK